MEQDRRQLGFYIKVIHTAMERYMNQHLKELGLTKPQMDMLICLEKARRQKKCISQKDLETYFHISNPSVSVMLDRLESKELISRVPSEHDRRIRCVVSTDKASRLTSELFAIQAQGQQFMFREMSQEQIDAGFSFLQAVWNNLSRKEDMCFDQDIDEAD